MSTARRLHGDARPLAAHTRCTSRVLVAPFCVPLTPSPQDAGDPFMGGARGRSAIWGQPRDSKETASWAVDRIAERMEQSPIPIHPAEGIDGHGFKILSPNDPEDTRAIGFFPDQNVVTISILDVSITIRKATASAARDGIRVDAGDGSVRALFLRDGHLAVAVFPAPVPCAARIFAKRRRPLG